MNIYVGNMPYSMTEEDVKNLFAQYGNVVNVRLISDRETGRAKGFGFVEMADANEANAAIGALNGSMQGGRALVVNEARPREEKPRFGGGRSGERRPFGERRSFGGNGGRGGNY